MKHFIFAEQILLDFKSQVVKGLFAVHTQRSVESGERNDSDFRGEPDVVVEHDGKFQVHCVQGELNVRAAVGSLDFSSLVVQHQAELEIERLVVQKPDLVRQADVE